MDVIGDFEEGNLRALWVESDPEFIHPVKFECLLCA